jgi:hypothetical protein
VTDSPLCGGDPLARQLAALAPAPAALPRDKFLFAAGAASRDRDVRFWRRLALGQTAAAGLLVGVGVASPEYLPAGRPAETARLPDARPTPAAREAAPLPRAVPEPSSEPATVARSRPADADAETRAKMLHLRAAVLAAGIDVLPTPAGRPTAVDPRQLERSLQLQPGVLAAPVRPDPK